MNKYTVAVIGAGSRGHVYALNFNKKEEFSIVAACDYYAEQLEKMKDAFGDEFKEHFNEEVLEGKKTRMPKRVLPALALVTLSLLMVVCSSVMVSRASREVSKLENQIESLEDIRDDLDADLEVKNNMLMIKEIAVKEYGMISAQGGRRGGAPRQLYSRLPHHTRLGDVWHRSLRLFADP